MRSTECFGAPEVPQTANRIASASVDFPLPRAPIMQVTPLGMLMLNPGRKPPLSRSSQRATYVTSTASGAGALTPEHRALLQAALEARPRPNIDHCGLTLPTGARRTKSQHSVTS